MRAAQGWRLHRLRESPFVSFSLDMNYRVLVKLDGETAYVHRAIKHDLADEPRITRNANAASGYGVATRTLQPADLHGVLAALDLPERDIAPFRTVQTEQELTDALATVAPLVMELALDLYETTGLVPERTRHMLYAPDQELQAALQGRLREWSVYLHPSQRFIVELPPESRVAVSGSAGTGKTVCAWHRIRALADAGISVALVCPDHNALSVSQAHIKELLRDAPAKTYYFVPNSAAALVELAETVDHVVIDEGQEISPEWYRAIGSAVSGTSKGLTLFHDLNQLGGHIPRGDERMFRHRFERWQESLRAIPGCTRLELSVNYRNSREIATYYSGLLGRALPQPLRVELPAYSTADVIVDRGTDTGARVAKSAKHLLALREQYVVEEMAVVCCPPVVKPDALARGLVQFGLPAHTDTHRESGLLVTTPNQFRGHERKAVIVVTTGEDAPGAWGRAIEAYIACSQARDRLIVV